MAPPKKYATEEEKREAARIRSALWREAHKEESNARAREWSKNNLEKRRAAYARRPEHYAEMSRKRSQKSREKFRQELERLRAENEQLKLMQKEV